MLWDAVQRKELTAIRSDSELQSFFLSKDGKVLVTRDQNGGRWQAWDVISQKQLSAISSPAREVPRTGENANEFDRPAIAALSADGQLMAFADANEVRIWKTGSTEVATLPNKHDAPVTAIALAVDSKLIASGDSSGGLKIWDVATRQSLATFKAHKDAVAAVVFSPDGRTVASGGEAGDGTVKLYGIPSMRELLTFAHASSPTSEVHAMQGGEDAVTRLFFSADGRSLITLSGNRMLRIWRGASDSDPALKSH